jgi:predicted xylose isomerase-like sugar epimerase
MDKLRTAEAAQRGVDIATMHALQGYNALKTWLSVNKSEWQAYATAASSGDGSGGVDELGSG